MRNFKSPIFYEKLKLCTLKMFFQDQEVYLKEADDWPALLS